MRSLTGTQDWTFVPLRFNSGNGHHGSTAQGMVLFDRVRLVEVR